MAAILFVDDEPAIRDMLGTVLKLAGHLPLDAADAEEARSVLRSHGADLALVDIMMPGEAGFSLARDLLDAGMERIDVILRRTQPRIFTDGGLTIDYSARSVALDGESVPLTATEFDLLALLTRNAGAALSRDKILSAVWGWDFVGETRTVDVHVQRLRAKLGPERIETVYKYGYRWQGGAACGKD